MMDVHDRLGFFFFFLQGFTDEVVLHHVHVLFVIGHVRNRLRRCHSQLHDR